MHVTSNPLFAFHDDVFPSFANNAASQLQFPVTPSTIFGPHSKTIVPDNFFSRLEEFDHISSLLLQLNGTESFEFSYDFQVRINEGFNIFKSLFLEDR